MVALQLPSVLVMEGGASSSSMAEPHFSTAQTGASRSVSPSRARRARRLFEARKFAEDIWYLSIKRDDGSTE